MQTKEQERAALNQIETILSGCDPDGYVRAAFNGCVEFARVNIDSDFLNDPLALLAERDEKIVALRRLCEFREATVSELEKKLKTAQETIEKLRDQNAGLFEKAEN